MKSFKLMAVCMSLLVMALLAGCSNPQPGGEVKSADAPKGASTAKPGAVSNGAATSETAKPTSQ